MHDERRVLACLLAENISKVQAHRRTECTVISMSHTVLFQLTIFEKMDVYVLDILWAGFMARIISKIYGSQAQILSKSKVSFIFNFISYWDKLSNISLQICTCGQKIKIFTIYLPCWISVFLQWLQYPLKTIWISDYNKNLFLSESIYSFVQCNTQTHSHVKKSEPKYLLQKHIKGGY